MYRLLLTIPAVVLAILGIELVTGSKMSHEASYSVIAYWSLGTFFLLGDMFLLGMTWRKTEQNVAHLESMMMLPKETPRSLFIWSFGILLLFLKVFDVIENLVEKKYPKRSTILEKTRGEYKT